jgi:hypothetical protein
MSPLSNSARKLNHLALIALSIYLTMSCGFAASAAAPDCRSLFRPATPTAALVDLSRRKELMNQKDARLQQYPNSNTGLCTSTCLLNATLASMDHLGFVRNDFADSKYRLFHRLMDLAGAVDKKRDWYLNESLSLIPDFMSQWYGTDRVIETSSILAGSKGPEGITRADISPSEDTLKLASVTTEKGSAHAIIIVSVGKTTLRYLDPNRPDQIMTVRYKVGKRRSLPTIEITWSKKTDYGAKTGLVQAVLVVKVVTGEKAKFDRIKQLRRMEGRTFNLLLNQKTKFGKVLKGAQLSEVIINDQTGEADTMAFNVQVGEPVLLLYKHGNYLTRDSETVVVPIDSIVGMKMKPYNPLIRRHE